MNWKTQMKKATQPRGFSLLEVILVLFVAMVVMGMAMISLSNLVPMMKANAGMNSVLATLRNAREQAISQRRNVQVEFLGLNQIRLTRMEIVPPGATTVLGVFTFDGGIQTRIYPAVPDTPDAFGNATAISFGGTPLMMFLSNGTFVDAGGNPLNGTVFLGLPNRPETARAVSIVGATGRLRAYRWTGNAWAE